MRKLNKERKVTGNSFMISNPRMKILFKLNQFSAC